MAKQDLHLTRNIGITPPSSGSSRSLSLPKVREGVNVPIPSIFTERPSAIKCAISMAV